MDPITQAFIQGAAGAGGDKIYVDEVFNTKTYRGNATERSITTGLDIAGEGGLIWFKNRELSNQSHRLVDTTALPDSSSPWYSYILQTNSAAARGATANGFKSFNSDGFTIQTDNSINGNNDKQVAWSFRKAPGFFDIVTWTGTGSAQNISHSLGSIPGMILVKRTSYSEQWVVYHRDLGTGKFMTLNDTSSEGTDGDGAIWGQTTPTSTQFTVGTHGMVNGNGSTYVAYVFAGGSSTSAGAHSIFYNSPAGTVRRILCGDASNTTADFNFGTGDLTIECWIKCSASQGNYPRVVAIGPQWQAEMAALQWHHANNANRVSFYCYNHSSSTTDPLLKSRVKNFNGDGQWHHCAVTRSGNTWRLFVDGVIEDVNTWTGSTNTANSYCTIGNTPGTATTAWFGGYISNVRVVKGTAVYTDSFRPPTKALTNITNTKLLCCNNLSGTAATVTPIALTETNINQNQTENPFDDPEGFQFGEGGDQSIVKCGSYIGNGSSTGPEINLGFEPQWVMAKRTDANADWLVWDIMRGIVTGGTTSDPMLYPNEEYAESSSIYRMDLTSRGFKLTSSNGAINANGGEYMYMAIRRPDPLVGKPALVGTDVFAIDNDTNTNPDFRSNFPVDFAFIKSTSTGNWFQSARLMQNNRMYINTAAAESTGQSWTIFDFGDPDGWSTGNFSANEYSWMWKRHAGFDVVAYSGDGESGGQYLPHNLNAVPEMIWCKSRTQGSSYWGVYHFGLNGGTNPQSWRVNLHNANANVITSFWNATPPTSEMFSVGNTWTNSSGEMYIAMLFNSVAGISKVGYYTGNGSATQRTITTGFQPRFLILKNADGGNNWFILDTVRGWANGADYTLTFNNDAAQYAGENVGQPTSTGFTITNALANFNESGSTYIYYAHA